MTFSMFRLLGRKIGEFDNFRNNIHSQNGEDGIIGEILQRIGRADCSRLFVVEFGAWDGMHLSNTFHLVQGGAKAVYIEGDDRRYRALLRTQRRFPNITPVQSFISPSCNDSSCLDAVLAKFNVPRNFDVLSIDIDSYDLDVWRSLTCYRPKIVVIEIMSEIPPNVRSTFLTGGLGNSFLSTIDVAEEKEYRLLAHVGNLIFIDMHVLSDFSDRFENRESIELYNDFWSDMPLIIRAVDYTISFLLKPMTFLKRFRD